MTRASEPRHPRSAASSEAARRLSADTTTRPDAAEHIQRELSLIRALVNQDAHAWQTFTATYQNLIYARVRQTLSECQFSLSAADDVCADVFAELLDNRCASLRSFQGRSRLSTWLSVVTRRICLRFVTRQRPAPSMRLSDPSLALVTGDQPDADILHEESLQEMSAALSHLSDQDQRVLQLFYFDNCTYREISQFMSISVNSVGPKLQRATQRLRSAFRKKDRPHPK